MDAFLGDAYKEDASLLQRSFGIAITDSPFYYVPSTEAGDMCEPQMEAVVGLKENNDIPMLDQRRIVIATNSMYTCYVVKGNQIRVLSPQTSNKLLLKGHDSTVLDMKIAERDTSILCSTSQSETIFWKIDGIDGELAFTKLHIAYCPGKIVASHPHSADVWAVANQSKVTFVSLSARDCPGIVLNCGDSSEVRDMCYSADGKNLIVSYSNGFETFTLPALSDLVSGSGVMDHGQDRQFVSVENLCSVRSFEVLKSRATGIITASTCDTAPTCRGSGTLKSTDRSPVAVLHAWIGNGKSYFKLQELYFSLPLIEDRKVGGSIPPLLSLCIDSPDKNFVTVYDKQSNRAACIALRQSSDPVGLPFYHMTYLNLGFKNMAAVTMTRDSSSVHEGESGGAKEKSAKRLEIISYQLDYQSRNCSAIQIYNVAVDEIRSVAVPTALPQPPTEVRAPINSTSSLMNALGITPRLSVAAASPTPTAPPPGISQSPSASAKVLTATVEEIPADTSIQAVDAKKKMSLFKGLGQSSGSPGPSLLSLLNHSNSTENLASTISVAALAPVPAPVFPVSAPVATNVSGTAALKNALFGGKSAATKPVSTELVGPEVATSGPAFMAVPTKKSAKKERVEKREESFEVPPATPEAAVSKQSTPIVAAAPAKLTLDVDQMQEIANMVSSTMLKSLNTQIEKIVKANLQSFSDKLNKTIDGSLSEGFKKNFNGPILDKFESGTREVFSQISTAIAGGNLGTSAASSAAAEIAELREEVSNLRSTVQDMRSILSTHAAGSYGMTGKGILEDSGEEDDDEVSLDDPWDLLEKNQMNRAVEVMLDRKNIQDLVSLLSVVIGERKAENELSLAAKLCGAQQLTADLCCEGNPIEGLPKRLSTLKTLLVALCEQDDDDENDIIVQGHDLVDMISKDLRSGESKILATLTDARDAKTIQNELKFLRTLVAGLSSGI